MATDRLDVGTDRDRGNVGSGDAAGGEDLELRRKRPAPDPDLSETRKEYREFLSTDEGVDTFGTVLDGKTFDERTLAEQTEIEILLTLLLGGRRKGRFKLPRLIEVDPSKLPNGVNGAFVKDLGPNGTIVISKKLPPARRREVLLEEFGEALGSFAADRGIRLAPGDIGARFLRALKGKKVSPEETPWLFRDKPSDTTRIFLKGKYYKAWAAAEDPKVVNLPGGLARHFAGAKRLPQGFLDTEKPVVNPSVSREQARLLTTPPRRVVDTGEKKPEVLDKPAETIKTPDDTPKDPPKKPLKTKPRETVQKVRPEDERPTVVTQEPGISEISLGRAKVILGGAPVSWHDLKKRLLDGGFKVDTNTIAGGEDFAFLLLGLLGKDRGKSQFTVADLGKLLDSGVVTVVSKRFNIDLSKLTRPQQKSLLEYAGRWYVSPDLWNSLGLNDADIRGPVTDAYSTDGKLVIGDYLKAIDDGFIAFGRTKLVRVNANAGSADQKLDDGGIDTSAREVKVTTGDDIPPEHRGVAFIDVQNGTRSGGFVGFTEIQYKNEDGEWVTFAEDKDKDGHFTPFRIVLIYDKRKGPPEIRATAQLPPDVDLSSVPQGFIVDYLNRIIQFPITRKETVSGNRKKIVYETNNIISLIKFWKLPILPIISNAEIHITVETYDMPDTDAPTDRGFLIQPNRIAEQQYVHDQNAAMKEWGAQNHDRIEIQYRDENGDWQVAWATQGGGYNGTRYEEGSSPEGPAFIPLVNGKPPKIRTVHFRSENKYTDSFTKIGKEITLDKDDSGEFIFSAEPDGGNDPSSTDSRLLVNVSLQGNIPQSDTSLGEDIFEAAGVDTDDTLNAQKLLNGLGTLNIGFDDGDFSFEGGDAANALIAINGGPLSVEDLDALIDSGVLSISGDKWTIDPSKLSQGQRRQLVASILDSDMSKGDKVELLKKLGIIEDVRDLELIDKKFGNGDGELTGEEIKAIPPETKLFVASSDGAGLFEVSRDLIDDFVPDARDIFRWAKIDPDDTISGGQINDVLGQNGFSFDPDGTNLSGAHADDVLNAIKGGGYSLEEVQFLIDEGVLVITPDGKWTLDLSKLDARPQHDFVSRLLGVEGGEGILDALGFSDAERRDLDYAFGNGDGELTPDEFGAAREELGDDVISFEPDDVAIDADLADIIDEVREVEKTFGADPDNLERLMEYFGVSTIAELRQALVAKGIALGSAVALGTFVAEILDGSAPPAPDKPDADETDDPDTTDDPDEEAPAFTAENIIKFGDEIEGDSDGKISGETLTKVLKEKFGLDFDANGLNLTEADLGQVFASLTAEGELDKEGLGELLDRGLLKMEDGKYKLDDSKLTDADKLTLLRNLLDASGGISEDTDFGNGDDGKRNANRTDITGILTRIGLDKSEILLIDMKLGNNNGIAFGDDLNNVPDEIELIKEPEDDGDLFSLNNPFLQQTPSIGDKEKLYSSEEVKEQISLEKQLYSGEITKTEYDEAIFETAFGERPTDPAGASWWDSARAQFIGLWSKLRDPISALGFTKEDFLRMVFDVHEEHLRVIEQHGPDIAKSPILFPGGSNGEGVEERKVEFGPGGNAVLKTVLRLNLFPGQTPKPSPDPNAPPTPSPEETPTPGFDNFSVRIVITSPIKQVVGTIANTPGPNGALGSFDVKIRFVGDFNSPIPNVTHELGFDGRFRISYARDEEGKPQLRLDVAGIALLHEGVLDKGEAFKAFLKNVTRWMGLMGRADGPPEGPVQAPGDDDDGDDNDAPPPPPPPGFDDARGYTRNLEELDVYANEVDRVLTAYDNGEHGELTEPQREVLTNVRRHLVLLRTGIRLAYDGFPPPMETLERLGRNLGNRLGRLNRWILLGVRPEPFPFLVLPEDDDYAVSMAELQEFWIAAKNFIKSIDLTNASPEMLRAIDDLNEILDTTEGALELFTEDGELPDVNVLALLPGEIDRRLTLVEEFVQAEAPDAPAIEFPSDYAVVVTNARLDAGAYLEDSKAYLESVYDVYIKGRPPGEVPAKLFELRKAAIASGAKLNQLLEDPNATTGEIQAAVEEHRENIEALDDYLGTLPGPANPPDAPDLPTLPDLEPINFTAAFKKFRQNTISYYRSIIAARKEELRQVDANPAVEGLDPAVRTAFVRLERLEERVNLLDAELIEFTPETDLDLRQLAGDLDFRVDQVRAIIDEPQLAFELPDADDAVLLGDMEVPVVFGDAPLPPPVADPGSVGDRAIAPDPDASKAMLDFGAYLPFVFFQWWNSDAKGPQSSFVPGLRGMDLQLDNIVISGGAFYDGGLRFKFLADAFEKKYPLVFRPPVTNTEGFIEYEVNIATSAVGRGEPDEEEESPAPTEESS